MDIINSILAALGDAPVTYDSGHTIAREATLEIGGYTVSVCRTEEFLRIIHWPTQPGGQAKIERIYTGYISWPPIDRVRYFPQGDEDNG